jgi:hypothetical protein
MDWAAFNPASWDPDPAAADAITAVWACREVNRANTKAPRARRGMFSRGPRKNGDGPKKGPFS